MLHLPTNRRAKGLAVYDVLRKELRPGRVLADPGPADGVREIRVKWLDGSESTLPSDRLRSYDAFIAAAKRRVYDHETMLRKVRKLV